jgi:hypothetical protein
MFATLSDDDRLATVKVSREDQAALVAADDGGTDGSPVP